MLCFYSQFIETFNLSLPQSACSADSSLIRGSLDAIALSVTA